MAENQERNRRLWKVAELIVEKQKAAYDIPDAEKGVIVWESLKEDWFDCLEEELFPESTN